MPKIYMLVGVPGSGKSTWTQYMKNDHPEYKDLEVVSFDNKIMQLAQIDGIKDYSTAWQKVDKRHAERMMQNQFEDLVARKQSFIIDMTNLSVKSRRKRLSQIGSDYTKYAMVFPVTKDLMLERNELRKAEGKYIHPDTLDTMYHSFVMPTKDEGFDEIFVQGA